MPRLTQPDEMKTKNYVYGVDTLNGYDAWALFEACALGEAPNRTDWLGKTFLHACAELGNQPVAALLLDAGADINARDIEFQGTPLAAAVRSCCTVADSKQTEHHRRKIEFLLQRGAKPRLPGDKPWSTPLAWSTRHGRSDLVELLNRANEVE